MNTEERIAEILNAVNKKRIAEINAVKKPKEKHVKLFIPPAENLDTPVKEDPNVVSSLLNGTKDE